MNATLAAIETGYCKNADLPKDGYYTYALLCPMEKDVFYVGKGQKDRVLQHKNSRQNRIKTARVRAILEAGLAIEYLILSVHESEQEAYESETDLLNAIGYHNLTNISPNETLRKREITSRMQGWRFLEPISWFDSVQAWALRSLELLRPYKGQRRIMFMGEVMSQEREDWWIKTLEDIAHNGFGEDDD